MVWTAAAGDAYLLEESPDLTLTNWNYAGAATAASPRVEFGLAPATSNIFYRLISLGTP